MLVKLFAAVLTEEAAVEVLDPELILMLQIKLLMKPLQPRARRVPTGGGANTRSGILQEYVMQLGDRALLYEGVALFPVSDESLIYSLLVYLECL